MKIKIQMAFIGLLLSIILGCGGGGGGSDPLLVTSINAKAVTDFNYNFDETSGSTATNSADNYYNGTIYGASRVIGKVGNALHFGSPGAKVEIPMYIYGIPFKTNTVSIDAWINLDTITPGQISQIVGDGDSGLTCFRFLISNGKLVFLLSDGSAFRTVITGNQTLLANTWYHVAITYNGTTATTYINGTVDNTNNITFPIVDFENSIFIACANSLYQFYGTIDELRISKSLRSSADINSYYQMTK